MIICNNHIFDTEFDYYSPHGLEENDFIVNMSGQVAFGSPSHRSVHNKYTVIHIP